MRAARLTFFLLLAATLFFPSRSDSQCWVYSYSGTTSWLNGISFSDSKHGFIVGDNGTVLRTANGGASWPTLNFKISSPFYAVDCLDSNTITLVGYNVDESAGMIFRSTTGGLSWNKQTSGTTEVLSAVSFISKDTGLTAGTGGTILYTTDGGGSWRPRTSGTTVDLHGVAFLTRRKAIAVGAFGVILRTTNGGISWDATQFGSASLNAVTFVDTATGYIAGMNGTILKTTNGGVDWMDLSINSEYLFYAISFADANRGTAAGFSQGNGILAYTTDGGSLWQRITIKNNALFGVAVTDSSIGTAITWTGGIIHEAPNCSQAGQFTQELPSDGSQHEPLSSSVSASRYLTLQWNLLPAINITGTTIQLGTDSTFSTGVIVNTLVTLKGSLITRTFIVSNLHPATKYFWRLRLNFDDGTSSNWTSVWRFTTANGTVAGQVFEDNNRDGIWNPGERSLNNWQVDLSGNVKNSVLTDTLGRFQFTGIDSGGYVVNAGLPLVWNRTVPSDTSYKIMLGHGDSVGGLLFGNYFPWNSVSGIVYDDQNENGILDPGEPGLANWNVHSQGAIVDSAVTDGNGLYIFPRLTLGTMTFTSVAQPGWEQINPQLGGGYTTIISSYDQHLSGRNFSIHHIPTRIKIPLFVKDNSEFAYRYIWWGVRSHATDGIWGADTFATNIDFAEGEFDLPPRTFGLFDARFEAPPSAAGQFGYGSWTDMRALVSPAQADTYRVTFNPGYFYGGDYPMTLQWTRALVESSYSGPVSIKDIYGNSVNMKAADYMIVPDTNVKFLTIVASSPRLPVVGVNEDQPSMPREFALEQNYPNPFNPTTVIRYQLPAGQGSGPYNVTLRVYDVLGQVVATLVDRPEEPGYKSVEWNASSFSSGMYLCRITAGPFHAVRKLLLLK